jgi:type II secretion system protein G
MKKRNHKGFTLIELLIVVAIIGIIVAIAIPNLLNAIQRAKQKRTMGDMRSAGTAAEAYAVDFNHYPAAAAGYTPPSGLSSAPTTTFGKPGSGFNAQVTPTYIRLLPLTDGWSSYFLYGANTGNQDYQIYSNGKNGSTDTATWGETTNFNADIVFIDGQFVQYPAGAQN